MATDLPDLDQFRADARAWLEANARPRVSETAPAAGERSARVLWGEGSDDVAVFHNLDEQAERTRLAECQAWQAAKFDAGYAMINWPVALGGRGLPNSYLRAYNTEEARFEVPNGGELPPTSMGLIATTVAAFGTPEQHDRWIRPLMRQDEYGCQLFSEPGAGSDLASLATKAVRDGDEWVLNGQKVWTSGARFAHWGLAITRTDPSVPKHKGLTAFMVPLQAPGVDVRPIRQMTGGSCFNEVFLTDVRLDDSYRLGPVGDGWRVALTCLGFERDHSGGGGGSHVGGGYHQVAAAAAHFGLTGDAIVRQALADLYIQHKVAQYTNRRAAAKLKAGQTPGPEGSLGKLMWTANMARVSDVISRVLGPRLVADTGEWGTYAWGEHVLGAPGYRIAGGSDEIQRNIIGERVLGLPAEPRVDKDIPFNATVGVRA
ncbi:MAG TPA: acyl-CoA dehydrogenase [Acidimicrobiaceae bacterium]|nr:acyl-CoA dehydrogenase [Acidimicrobiaceae bacterium]